MAAEPAMLNLDLAESDRLALAAASDAGGLTLQMLCLDGQHTSSLPCFGVLVDVPEQCEFVVLGAARQTVWAAAGELPVWGRRIGKSFVPDDG